MKGGTRAAATCGIDARRALDALARPAAEGRHAWDSHNVDDEARLLALDLLGSVGSSSCPLPERENAVVKETSVDGAEPTSTNDAVVSAVTKY